jgi:hypothetical protein
MLTLSLTDKDPLKFNLKDQDTEREFKKMWFSAKGNQRLLGKAIKITTTNNEVHTIKFQDIKDCEFDDSWYLKGTVAAEKYQDRGRKETPMGGTSHSPRAKRRLFIDIIVKHGITLPAQTHMDPTLKAYLEAAQSSHTDTRVEMLAKAYLQTKGWPEWKQTQK